MTTGGYQNQSMANSGKITAMIFDATRTCNQGYQLLRRLFTRIYAREILMIKIMKISLNVSNFKACGQTRIVLK